MIEIFNIEFFIAFFKSIPESKFITNNFKCGDSRCFVGFTLPEKTIYKIRNKTSLTGEYTPTDEERETEFRMTYALAKLFDSKSPRKGIDICYKINNGDDRRYLQPTVKGRIMAALYDLKDQQQAEVNVIAAATIIQEEPVTI